MDNNFKTKLIKLAKELKIEMTESTAEKFYEYMRLLLEWNEKINLTAITEENDIILKHFIDSLTILKYIEDNASIVDVGSGAGLPGIPISIMNKKNEITLLDSLNKRIIFLQDIIEKLHLEKIEAIHGRAEEFGQDKKNRQKYDISVSRAVANLATLVEYMMPLVRVGGKCICMKGSEIEEELNNAKFAIKELGGQIEKVDKIILPNSDMTRNIVIIRKTADTPNKYPRKAGIPGKKPLIVEQY